jgi:SNF2 family DNA or RNA helicase
MEKRTAALKVPILPHNSPAADQPPKLHLPLFAHQLRALHRCLLIENDGSLNKEFGASHDYQSRGGCLADAVGMGKTATMIGLVLSSPRSSSEEGDTLVVAPGHLVQQWKAEIEKFSDAIEVVVGKQAYERVASYAPSGRYTHRIVLVDVEAVMNETQKFYYNWGWSRDPCRTRGLDRQTVELYKKAALFCVKSPRGPCSYEGQVYTGSLHMPFRPWRRVIFDEIQDLVSEGTASQKNLLQLSRTAKNVWLLSATPFPHGNNSVYANHELLGFCRLRMDVETETELPRWHPFEVIKRKLYIRSPKDVADDAVVASKRVTEETLHVEATELERKFFELEMNDIVSNNIFSEEYFSLRQMMVHPEASRKLREQINGKDADNRGGQRGRQVQNRNSQVGRFATVNSFARRSLNEAKTRFTQLEKHSIPTAEREISMVKSSWYLAMKVRQVRQSAVQANPFSRPSEDDPPVCLLTKEAEEIHKHYCKCPSYKSTSCTADNDAHFLDWFPGDKNVKWISGRNSIQHIIDYFKNVAKPGKKTPLRVDSDELHDFLDVYISKRKFTYEHSTKKRDELLAEKADLSTRIKALEESVKIGNMKGGYQTEEEELAARHGSKSAALIVHLQRIQEANERTIVFSYWHDTLSLVHKSLKKCDLRVSFCDGSARAMSQAITDFTSGVTSILLLSAQAKASGANLQCATNVVLLDPSGSSAEHGATLEKQAIGRAVRMGQENSVRVFRFRVRGTIEENLYAEIGKAATKLDQRSSDASYMCEDAHKAIDANVTKPKFADDEDEVCIGESITDKERIARSIAVAKEKNEIIGIDDSDDEEEEERKEHCETDVTMKEEVSPAMVVVKSETMIAKGKRDNAELGDGNKSPDGSEKRARLLPATDLPTTDLPATDESPHVAEDGYLHAPPGKLGFTIRMNRELGGAKIVYINELCAVKDQIEVGDRLVAVDGREITQISHFGLNTDKVRKFQIIRKKNNSDPVSPVAPLPIDQNGGEAKPQQPEQIDEPPSSLPKGGDAQPQQPEKINEPPSSLPKGGEAQPQQQEQIDEPPSSLPKGGEAQPQQQEQIDEPPSSLPPGWVELKSKGRSFYLNRTTGERSWDSLPGRVVSPETETTAATLNEPTTDGLKDFLAECALEEYLGRFVSAGVSSLLSLVGKAGDTTFMEQLVDTVGLSASQAIRLQILVSPKSSLSPSA